MIASMRYCIGLLVLLALAPFPALADEPQLATADAESQLTQIELALTAGRLTQAGSMLHALDGRLPNELGTRHKLLSAELHMASGDAVAAASAIDGLSIEDGDPCRFGGVSGWLAYQAGDWNRAISMLSKSVEACPDDAGRWNLMGLSLVRKAEAAAAIEAFDQALFLAPNHPALLNNRALAYAYLGMAGAAIADLERAVSIADGDSAIMANLAVLRANSGLEAPLTQGQDPQTQSLLLARAAEGASAADRHAAARSYYARALLRSERFDPDLWAKATADLPIDATKDENEAP